VTNDQLPPPPRVPLLRERPVPTEQEVWSLWGPVASTGSSSNVLLIACYVLPLVWLLAFAELVLAIHARSLYSEALRKQRAICLVMNQTAAAASPVCDALRLSTSIIPLKTDVYLYHGFSNWGTCTTTGAATIVHCYFNTKSKYKER